MIEGYVNSGREATVRLELIDQTGQTIAVRAVIDTGFTEHLTLPPDLIEDLSPPFTMEGSLTLADGRPETFGIYEVTVTWDGERRTIPAHGTGGSPLIGMALLENHSLRMEVVPSGNVTIEAIT